MIPTIPNGPQVYADSDGVVDVQMSDRFGRPWFMYRAREGYLGQKLNKKKDMDYALGMGRHTGILRPPALPRGPFMNHQPWHLRVLEPDIMMGRRGVLGWDGLDHNKGLMVNGGVAPSWWDDVMDWWDDLDHTERWLYGTAGIAVVAAAAAAAATVLTAGSIWVPIIGAGVFSASLGAHEWGGFRMDAYGPKDTAGRLWQLGGKIGMVLGGIGVAWPFMSLAHSAGTAIYGAAPVGGQIAMNLGGSALGLGYLGYVGHGMYNTFQDIRAGEADWIDFADRHAIDAAMVPLAAYGATRSLIRAGRLAAPGIAAAGRAIGRSGAHVGRRLGRVSTRLMRRGAVGWRIQRYPGAGGGGLNKVNLATGKRVPTGVVTGVDVHRVAARGGGPEPTVSTNLWTRFSARRLAMKNKALPEEPGYDWACVRSWCILWLRAFLEHAGRLETKEGWKSYRLALDNLPRLERRRIKRITDSRVDFILDVVTSNIDEAAHKKTALPGMFNDAVIGSKELLALLEQDLPLDIVTKEVQRIDDAM